MALRSLLFVWLAALLVFAQEGEYRHELSHLGQLEAPAQGQHSGKGQVPSHACERCLAYAGMGSAAVSSAPIVDFRSEPVASAPTPAVAFRSEFVSHYLSRAPPVLA
jgi:hypothetical protein